MRRLLLPLVSLLAFLLAMPALADAPTPMLWKASKGASSVYLLGSMHILKPGDYPLSTDVESAYKDADRLVFEISPDEMFSPATMTSMLTRGMFHDGRTLQSVLPPQTWKELLAYGEKNGLPASRLQMFEPWMVSLTVMSLETQKLGLDPASGLDMHFMTQAKSDHKPTQGLETADQQFAILAGASLDTQQQMLRQSLDELADFPKEMGREYDTWRHGDIAGMLAQTKKEFAKYPELYQQILVQRNRAWIPKIEKLFDGRHDTLVVVGALHLPGPDGVVKMLQARGYSVERICTGCARTKH
jgi:uncharacterized protein YbaP (TraB family)